MRNAIELAVYASLSLGWLESVWFWLRIARRSNRPRAAISGLFMVGGMTLASMAVVTVQGFYVADRSLVVQVGRWVRPIMALGLGLALLGQWRWRRGA